MPAARRAAVRTRARARARQDRSRPLPGRHARPGPAALDPRRQVRRPDRPARRARELPDGGTLAARAARVRASSSTRRSTSSTTRPRAASATSVTRARRRARRPRRRAQRDDRRGGAGRCAPRRARAARRSSTRTRTSSGFVAAPPRATRALAPVRRAARPAVRPRRDDAARRSTPRPRALGQTIAELPPTEIGRRRGALRAIRPVLADAAAIARGAAARHARLLPRRSRALATALRRRRRPIAAPHCRRCASAPRRRTLAALERARATTSSQPAAVTQAARTVMHSGARRCDLLEPAQIQCNIVGLCARNLGSTIERGRRRRRLDQLRADRRAARRRRCSHRRDRDDLHANPYPNRTDQECEAGNEPFAPGQAIGNPPGNQPNTTEQTRRRAGVRELRRARRPADPGRRRLRDEAGTTGVSPRAVGIVAIARPAGRACTSAFTKRIPFVEGYRVNAVFQTSNQLRNGSPVRDRRRRRRQGRRGSRPRARHDRSVRDARAQATTAARSTRDARAADPPAAVPRGRLLRRPDARAARARRSSRTAARSRSSQTAVPVQFHQILTAASTGRRARACAALVDEAATALDDGGAEALGTGAAARCAPALRDGAIVGEALRGAEPHDVSELVDRRRAGRRALGGATSASCASLVDRPRHDDRRAGLRGAARCAATVARARRRAAATRPRALTRDRPLARRRSSASPRRLRPSLRIAPPVLRDTRTGCSARSRAVAARASCRGSCDDWRRHSTRAAAALRRRLTSLFPLVTPVTDCVHERALPVLQRSGRRRRALDRPAGLAGARSTSRSAWRARSQNFDGNGLSVRYLVGPRRPARSLGDLGALGQLTSARQQILRHRAALARRTLRAAVPARRSGASTSRPRPQARTDRRSASPGSQRAPRHRSRRTDRAAASGRQGARKLAREGPLMLKRQLERYGRWLIAIAVLDGRRDRVRRLHRHQAAAAHSRSRTATRSAPRSATSTGCSPGLGQPVNVAGVKVGTITDAELRDGRAHRDDGDRPRASCRGSTTTPTPTLVPNTPLKDMPSSIAPGGPPAAAPCARAARSIPVARTTPPIDSDELLAALDADTRDFFELLVAGAADGTRGRGRGPARAAQGARADRRAGRGRSACARRVSDASCSDWSHNLALVGDAAGAKDRELAALVESTSTTIGALARQEAALRGSVARLPGDASGAALEPRQRDRVRRRARPGRSSALLPATRRLPAALRDPGPARAARPSPCCAPSVRPLVKALQPLARDLGPTATDLSAVTPALTSALPGAQLRRQRAGVQPAGRRRGLPVLARLVRAQRRLDAVHRGCARRRLARARHRFLLGGHGGPRALAAATGDRRSGTRMRNGGERLDDRFRDPRARLYAPRGVRRHRPPGPVAIATVPLRPATPAIHDPRTSDHGDHGIDHLMGMRAPRPAAIAIMLVFALSVFGFTLFVWRSFGGTVPLEAKGYRFKAPFGAEAVQLTVNAQVRISGVPVGKVAAIDRTTERAVADDRAREPRTPRVHRDARAILRTKTLLGETFVEISPGSPAGSRAAGRRDARRDRRCRTSSRSTTCSRRSTRRPAKALREFLDGVERRARGRGESLNAALGNAGPGLRDLGAFVDALERRDAEVESLVRDSGLALEALAARGGDLRSLVVAGDELLSATAARDDELTATVRALPGFLRTLRGTLAEAEGAARDAAPTLSAIRPVAPRVPQALRATAKLAPELEAVLRGLRPAITASERGLPAATRIVRAAGPLLDALYPAARELVPVVQVLNAYRREILAVAANVAAATQASTELPDGSQRRVLRTMIPLTNELIDGYKHRLASNRHNPYLRPGGLADLTNGTIRAFDCDNVDNAQTVPVIGSGAPPCLVQEPWDFNGRRRSFPQAERDGP